MKKTNTENENRKTNAENAKRRRNEEGREWTVTCQEAERLVTPFINDELTGDEVEAFLHHIEGCKSCQEELEIYFMVDVGLKQLDRDSGTFDIAGALEEKLEESYEKVSRMWTFRAFRYSVDTLTVMASALAVLLQLRIWLF